MSSRQTRRAREVGHTQRFEVPRVGEILGAQEMA
jgi:hypothetical protein